MEVRMTCNQNLLSVKKRPTQMILQQSNEKQVSYLTIEQCCSHKEINVHWFLNEL